MGNLIAQTDETAFYAARDMSATTKVWRHMQMHHFPRLCVGRQSWIPPNGNTDVLICDVHFS